MWAFTERQPERAVDWEEEGAERERERDRERERERERERTSRAMVFL